MLGIVGARSGGHARVAARRSSPERKFAKEMRVETSKLRPVDQNGHGRGEEHCSSLISILQAIPGMVLPGWRTE